MDYNISVFRIVKEKKLAKTYIERHEHEYFHYIYALSGHAMIEVDYNQFDVKERALIMVPPRVIHAVYSIDGFIGIDIKFLCDDHLTSLLENIGYCINGVTDYEDTLLKSFFYEALQKRDFYEHIINAQMLEIIFHILRRKQHGLFMIQPDEVSGNSNVNFYPKKYLREVLDYIDKNLDKDIAISDLAQICNYNKNYFSTYFKECVGYTPQKYINKKKMEKAISLIMSGDKTITQVSEELGFTSIHYFSRLFKRELGVSPSVYFGRTSIDIGINIQKNKYTPQSEFEFQAQKMC